MQVLDVGTVGGDYKYKWPSGNSELFPPGSSTKQSLAMGTSQLSVSLLGSSNEIGMNPSSAMDEVVKSTIADFTLLVSWAGIGLWGWLILVSRHSIKRIVEFASLYPKVFMRSSVVRLPHITIVICLCILTPSLMVAAELHKWTSSNGNFSAEAEFVKLEQIDKPGLKTVTLRRNGKEITVPFEKLSEDSKKLALNLHRTQSKKLAPDARSAIGPLNMEGPLGKQQGRGDVVADDKGLTIGQSAGEGFGYYSLDALAGVRDVLLRVTVGSINETTAKFVADNDITADWLGEQVLQRLKDAKINVHVGKNIFEDAITDALIVEVTFDLARNDGSIVVYNVEVFLLQPVRLRREPRERVLARTFRTPGLLSYDSPFMKSMVSAAVDRELTQFVNAHAVANEHEQAPTKQRRTRLPLDSFSPNLAPLDPQMSPVLTFHGFVAEGDSTTENYCHEIGITQELIQDLCRTKLERRTSTQQAGHEKPFLQLEPNPIKTIGPLDGFCFRMMRNVTDQAEFQKFPGLFAYVDTNFSGGIGVANGSDAPSTLDSAIDYEVTQLTAKGAHKN